MVDGGRGNGAVTTQHPEQVCGRKGGETGEGEEPILWPTDIPAGPDEATWIPNCIIESIERFGPVRYALWSILALRVRVESVRARKEGRVPDRMKVFTSLKELVRMAAVDADSARAELQAMQEKGWIDETRRGWRLLRYPRADEMP